jgi:hypothetical protein
MVACHFTTLNSSILTEAQARAGGREQAGARADGRKSPIRRLPTPLDEARRRGWTVADMKNDWKRIFAFEER